MRTQVFPFQSQRAGMTLLEVILSIAILGGSVVVLGEMARLSFQNALSAREIVQAELLAESIIAKVRLGIIEMTPVFEMQVGLQTTNPLDIVEDTHAVTQGNVADSPWLYSLDIVNVDVVYDLEENEIAYLVEIAVTVRRNLPIERRPVTCRLVRWLALEPETTTMDEAI